MAARGAARPRDGAPGREWEDDGSTDPGALSNDPITVQHNGQLIRCGEMRTGTVMMLNGGVTETKAGKRRRDLVTRIEKVREANFAKREE